MSKAAKKKTSSKKSAPKKSVAAAPAKPKLEVVKAAELGGAFVEYALPLTLGQLKAKLNASSKQATIDGTPEDNDSVQLEHGSYVTFTEKVKGN
jgi:hypothetical protein